MPAALGARPAPLRLPLLCLRDRRARIRAPRSGRGGQADASMRTLNPVTAVAPTGPRARAATRRTCARGGLGLASRNGAIKTTPFTHRPARAPTPGLPPDPGPPTLPTVRARGPTVRVRGSGGGGSPPRTPPMLGSGARGAFGRRGGESPPAPPPVGRAALNARLSPSKVRVVSFPQTYALETP